MKYESNHSDLPSKVLEELKSANVFYSAEYEENIRSTNSLPVYLYNDDFVQVASIHTIKGIFCQGSYPTESYCRCKDYDKDKHKAFLDECIVVLKRQYHVDWIAVPFAGSLFKAYPENSKRIMFGNYVIDLSLDESTLFSSITSKHRNMIRRGKKAGITFAFGNIELLDDYLLLDKQTWEKSGVEADHREEFVKYLNALKQHAIIGISYFNGEPQCGIFGFYNQSMFYYVFGASSFHPEPGATHSLQWEMIKLMKEKRVRYYNFVGCRINEDENSKYHNIQHFKKGFGGNLVECYLFKSVLNKNKKKMFDVACKLTNRTDELEDVIDQEIAKWEEINNK